MRAVLYTSSPRRRRLPVERLDATGTSRRRRGYSLIDLMVAIAIVAIIIGLGQVMFIRLQQQNSARSGMRLLQGLAREARNSALLLGAAAGTDRVRVNASCQQAAFSADNTQFNGRAALRIDMAAGVVTYVAQIVRIADVFNARGVSLPAYEIQCKSVNFTTEFKQTLEFVANLSRPNGIGPTAVIVFDSRGYVANIGAATVAIALRETRGRRHVQELLIHGSGYPCLSAAPGQNECRSAAN
jgi:type II secretory pathway pseudopilin PulG